MTKRFLITLMISLLIIIPVCNQEYTLAATDISNATIEWSIGQETTFLFEELESHPERHFNVKLGGKILKARGEKVGSNYNPSSDTSDCILRVDVNESGSSVTVQAFGRGGYSGQTKKFTLTFDTVDFWTRLYGKNRYDTMKAIVDEGFTKTGGTVVVATGAKFKDALAASGLAGLEKAPVVLTDGKSLSGQVRSVLTRLKPDQIYVAGGPQAISDKVLGQIAAATGILPDRVYGMTSAGTSAALAQAGNGRWRDDTAIIATNKDFKDALSIAPIAYAKGYPILLADDGKSLSEEVKYTLQDLGIKNVIIVGGPSAVTTEVEAEIRLAGIYNITRIEGKNGVLTSRAVAEWGLKHGMKADRMGFATSQDFPDALAGAALCGHFGSVLLLADDKAMNNASFPENYKSSIRRGYVFGGESAVGKKTYDRLVDSVAEIV